MYPLHMNIQSRWERMHFIRPSIIWKSISYQEIITLKTTLKGKHTVSTEKNILLITNPKHDYRIAYYLTTVFKKLTITQEMNDNYKNSLCTTHNVRGQ